MGNNSILATNAASTRSSPTTREGFHPDLADRHAGQYPGGESVGAGELLAELIALAKASPGN